MNHFRTNNLALCPYLEMNGLKFLRAEPALGRNDKPVVMFVFDDPLGVGNDLELDYMRSDFKRYRDLTLFFRNEIEKMKRRLDKLMMDDLRKTDDKYFSGEQ